MTKGTPASSQIITLERMIEERDAALVAANERIRVLTDGEALMRRNAHDWKESYTSEREVSDMLEKAMHRMMRMHDLMMAQVNHGASFYQAECLAEMNGAPIYADTVLSEVAAIRAKQQKGRDE